MNDLLAIFIDNMVPVLAIAGVGLYLRRRFDTSPAMISRMMFHVFSPALAFHALFTRDIGGGDFLRMYGGTLALTCTVALVGYLALRNRQASSRERAAALVSTFVFNGGNFGISIVSFAFGAEALSYAVIAYVAGSTTAYSLGVYASSQGRASILRSLGSVARTPSLYALLAAFALKAMGIMELPPALGRTSQLLAEASIPLMLVLLGLQLGGLGKPRSWRLVIPASAIRLLLAPMLSLPFAALFGLEGAARFAFILQAGMPTAVMTIVLAHEFDSDQDLALNLIMVTSLLSPLTLSVIIYLLQRGAI